MWRPIGGVLAAIAVTTAMDANGLSVFSALPLAPLMFLFWWLQKFSRVDVGFKWGSLRDHRLAVLYPLLVLGAATLIGFAGGGIDTSETNWSHFWLNFLVGGASTVLITTITEEGFFRGWLWASLLRAGQSRNAVVVWTSVAFSLWHLSAVSLDTGFDLPPAQIPVFMVNATLLGVIWGLIREVSGSVVVTSVSHGAWNGLNYALFAFGAKTGALGITETSIYGPEVGFVGVALNGAFALALWRWVRTRGTDAGP